MEVVVTKKFEKMLKKCSKEIKLQLIERLKIFRTDPRHPILKNHNLSGRLKNLRSINISSDWRVIFEEQPNKIILIALVPTTIFTNKTSSRFLWKIQ